MYFDRPKERQARLFVESDTEGRLANGHVTFGSSGTDAVDEQELQAYFAGGGRIHKVLLDFSHQIDHRERSCAEDEAVERDVWQP